MSTLKLRRSEAMHQRLIGVPFSVRSASMLDNLQKMAVRADPGVGSFLQSREWQEIQERMGRRTQRLASALVIRHDLPLGFHYLYCPRPLSLSDEFFIQASELAEKTGAIFLKIDPTSPLLEIRDSRLEIRPAHSLQPSATVLVDCKKSDQELLSDMHPKTRYNIRVAERHGVVVEPRAGRDAVRDFYELLQKTARRDNFSLHPKRYYECLTFLNSQEYENVLLFAACRGKVAATAMINFYKGTATYLHGASDYEFRNTMAPYALHWHIINEAKRRGSHTYDFGGIDPLRWPGVTRFKKGFGGEIFSYPTSQDIVFRPWLYRFYRFQRFLRHKQ